MLALVVDDDVLVRTLLTRLLSAQGWSVEAVGTATSALAAVNRSPPDLILVDFQLPDVDGVTLVRHWRAQGLTTPILAITSADSESVIDEMLRAGAHDVVAKADLDGALLERAIAGAKGVPAFPATQPAPRAPVEFPMRRPDLVLAGRALVVDDTAALRRLTRLYLEADGWTVEEADSARTGLVRALSERFDVLVLDYLLPDVDGAGLLHELRERGIETPVVVLSGHGDERLATEFVMSGVVDFVPKDGLTKARLREAMGRAQAAAGGIVRRKS